MDLMLVGQAFYWYTFFVVYSEPVDPIDVKACPVSGFVTSVVISL